MINKGGATVKKILLAAIIAVFGVASTAQAAPIAGTINLTGEVIVTEFGIDWVPAGGGSGIALVGETSGYFEPLEGHEARELDLFGLPTDSPLAIPFFETFPESPLPGLNFQLELILSCGAASLDPEDECDAGLTSPFVFQQTREGTTVLIFFQGSVTDPIGAPGETARWESQFDATFKEEDLNTPEEILARLDAVGSILAPYSGQKISTSAAIPEPATMLTFGLGTAVLAAHRRRRAKKNS